MRERAGEHVYGEGDIDLAAVVLERARRAGLSLGVAESCTGGLVGGRITDVPGSSDVFAGGVVCYSNRLKTELLDVSPALIAEHGAVSEAVARAMAEGTRTRIGVDVVVSVTGIAGPSGGTEEKPVGTVWFAVASPGGTESRRIIFPGSRKEIRERAAQMALFLVNRRLLAD
jgi:nicotinamide-nucleotide amidase